jgi:DNA polymerase (family 10)
MPSLPAALALLADIATIQGRRAEADELAKLSRHLDTTTEAAAGPATREALARLRSDGSDAVVRDSLEDIPGDLRSLLEREALSPAEVAELAANQHAVTAADLRALLDEGPPGVSPSIRERLQAALPSLRAERRPVPLGRSTSTVDDLLAVIQAHAPAVEQATAVGSIRRGAALVGDIEILAAAGDPAAVAEQLRGLPADLRLLHLSRRRAVLRIDRHELGLHIVTPDAFAAAELLLTGAPLHVARVRERAAQRELELSLAGLRRRGRPVDTATEADVYASLGLPFIPVELREGGDEIAAAERGDLPRLVERRDIRGDLHMHTDWSDGRDTLDAMIEAARTLGYEYVAITDHSVSASIARGLDEDRLARQREAVDEARVRFPDITILHGSEVDIRADGSLDFPDRVLESLDIVLASLHDAAGQSGAQLTDRYVAAMHHPLVQIVTHPTNRMIPGRAGYELDEGRLFEAAVKTGTLLEVDGAPGHLDMDGSMARRAIAAGVEITIDGDCHRAEWLGRQMAFGVTTARRGWVEARHVANTRTLGDLKSLLGRKRAS